MTSKIYFVYITCESAEQAEQIANICVKEKLAACANIIPGMMSVYEWKGEMRSDSEVSMILKTTEDRLDVLTKKVVEHHTYDCPCITAFEAASGFDGYFDWIRKSCAN